MATIAVFQQEDQTWAWRLSVESRTFVVAVTPGYPTAVAAAEGAGAVVAPTYQRLASRLASSLAGRPP